MRWAEQVIVSVDFTNWLLEACEHSPEASMHVHVRIKPTGYH